MNPWAPIGIFDSGVGGLSVVLEVQARLPLENVMYVADTAHAPYGDRTAEYVEDRCLRIGRFLYEQGSKMIIIGSNTGTAGGAVALRAKYDMPIVGMEPAIKAAAAVTKNAIVGVLATRVTLASAKFASLLNVVGTAVQVVTQPAPGLVERIERGDLDGPSTRTLVEKYVSPLLEKGADVIVLGSTHYVFLRALIAEVAGPGVALIDSGTAVAQHVERVLAERGMLSPGPDPGGALFWTSSTDAETPMILSRLYGKNMDVEILPVEFR